MYLDAILAGPATLRRRRIKNNVLKAYLQCRFATVKRRLTVLPSEPVSFQPKIVRVRRRDKKNRL